MDDAAVAELESAVFAHRAELHRYTARMTGSVFDGEDVLQDVLVAAMRSIQAGTRPDHVRAWLFRIAHNTSINFIRRRNREVPMADRMEEASVEPAPATVSDSLQAFIPLTPQQRSAVILRDVLGYTAAEVADLTDASVSQVKSSLHRGRAALRRRGEPTGGLDHKDRVRLDNYARLFNAHAFDELRDLLATEARLEVVGRESRSGAAAVGNYFGNYAEVDDWWLVPGVIEGRPCALVVDREDPGGPPRYCVMLAFEAEAVIGIRDFRYAPYVMADADWTRLPLE